MCGGKTTEEGGETGVSRIGYVRKGNARAPLTAKTPSRPLSHLLPRHVSLIHSLSSAHRPPPILNTTQQRPHPLLATTHAMATPSSSATSPSPALSYALPARSSASDSATSSATSDERDREQDLAEREERRRNLLARAEFAKVSSVPLFVLACVQRDRRDARCDTLGKTSCVYALGWEVVLLRRVSPIVLRDRARGA